MQFLFELDDQKEWLLPYHMFTLKFSDEPESSISKELNRFVHNGLLAHVAEGLYANIHAHCLPGHDQALIQFAKKVRFCDQMYYTGPMRANELGLTTQMPNGITFITDGRSYTYQNVLGIVEFVHQKIPDIRKIRGVVWNEDRGIYEATEKRVREDARHHRSYFLLDLMEEMNEER